MKSHFVIAFAAFLFATESWAGPLVDPFGSFQGRSQPTGFRLGKGTFHLQLGTGASYDTNVYFTDVNPQSDIALEVAPGIEYVLETRRMDANIGYRFSLLEYFSESVQSDRRHYALFNSEVQLTRRFQFKVENRFQRTSEPANVELLARVPHTTNEAKARLMFKTPGDDLDIGLSYTNVYQDYDPPLVAQSFFNNKVSLTSRVNVSSHFRFLPKTILFGDVEYGHTNFKNINDPTLVSNNDSQGFSTHLGLDSPISQRIRVVVSAGVTFLFFDQGPNSTALNGRAVFRYTPNPRVSMELGYDRISQVSTFSNYYDADQIFFNARWQFARKMEAAATARTSFLDFSGPNTEPSGLQRSDFVVQSKAALTYYIKRWLSGTTEYFLDFRDSNAQDALTAAEVADFTRHRFRVGLDFRY